MPGARQVRTNGTLLEIEMNDFIVPKQSTTAEDTLGNGGAMQQIKTSYTTAVAVQKPRELTVVKKRLLEESRLMGESFYYGWGSDKNHVEGPSIKGAMAAARCWGNCAIEPLAMVENRDAWVFAAAFVDLETGFTCGRQFRQSKRSTVHGKHDDERKDDMRFQIGQSKAIRNIVLNAIPQWLLDAAVAEAKQGVRDKIEKYVKSNGLPAAIDYAVGALVKLGVTEERIASKCDVAECRALTVDHLVILRGDIAAIQDGQERADTLFPGEAKDSLSETIDKAASTESKPSAEVKTKPEPVANKDIKWGDNETKAPRAAAQAKMQAGRRELMEGVEDHDNDNSSTRTPQRP